MNNSVSNTILSNPFVFAGYTDNYLEGKWVDIYNFEVWTKNNSLEIGAFMDILYEIIVIQCMYF